MQQSTCKEICEIGVAQAVYTACHSMSCNWKVLPRSYTQLFTNYIRSKYESSVHKSPLKNETEKSRTKIRRASPLRDTKVTFLQTLQTPFLVKIDIQSTKAKKLESIVKYIIANVYTGWEFCAIHGLHHTHPIQIQSPIQTKKNPSLFKYIRPITRTVENGKLTTAQLYLCYFKMRIPSM